MPELAVNAELAPATAATPLAGQFFASAATLAPYLGVLTPQALDAPEAETEALLTGAGLHDLGWLRRIAVRGEDRFRWLSGMVTNNVESLPSETGAYNFILNAQGRIQGDCTVWRCGETLEIELTAEQAEAILAHYDRFIIMDDVELIPLPDQSALGLTGPLAGQILAKLGLPVLTEQLTSVTTTLAGKEVRLTRQYGTLVPHYGLWGAAEEIPALWQALQSAGATPVGAAAIEALRIVEGIPAYGMDIQSRDLAQETAQTRALSFTKGCYLGQEIVERIRSRGQVHRHLRSVELFPASPGELPAVGTDLQSATGKPAGTLTSIASLQRIKGTRIFGIAMIRAEAEIGNHPLTYAGGTAQILNSPPKLTPASSAAQETQETI